MAQNKKCGFIRGRALLDTCATTNFVTEKFARRLNLPMRPCSLPISAINAMGTLSNHTIQITFKSTYNEFQKTLTFLTIPEIANLIPPEVFPRESIKIPSNIQLADPEFHLPRPIDMLIGSGTSLSLFSIGQINLSRDDCALFLQKTRLGWIIAGSIPEGKRLKQVTCQFVDLNKQIEKFWSIEEVGREKLKSEEEVEAENHFTKNILRKKDGRYVVRLPFRKVNEQGEIYLGNSYSTALKRFYALERKLNSNITLKNEYQRIIKEYLDLGHMSIATGLCDDGYYLPHHAVIKDSSTTTKVRIVFDASAKTTSGASLNDLLMVGPTIQNNIFAQLIKFRIHRFVITADIEKMYRQVGLHKNDRKYHRVLWRVDDKIKIFQLNTITFGISSSPFLAIRTIHKLADDEKQTFPLASNVLKNDLYVDDLLSGADTIEETRILRDQIIALLSRGGFNIRQWASNDARVLENLTDINVNSHLLLDRDSTFKTLGICWKTNSDKLTYNVNSIKFNSKITKRQMLSEIAKIYDPLGLLGPIILHAKLIMQRLWRDGLGWDESVPSHIYSVWSEFVTQIDCKRDLNIERRLMIHDPIEVQIHGFCDASNVGYGACLYLRSTNAKDKIICRLICAKSKVAPLKTLTIPRLELCGALLLARLYRESLSAIKININKIIFWSDSTIVLAWLKSSPHLLKTYVSNRIAEIQESCKDIEWRHIRTIDNPADAISRGQLPQEFIKNEQWFGGPTWLREIEKTWPREVLQGIKDIPEFKRTVCLVSKIEIDPTFYNKFSSYARFKRVIAYCLRFRNYKQNKGLNCEPNDVLLKVYEIQVAEIKILRGLQQISFQEEIQNLKNKNKTNRLSGLNPFIDNQDGLLRVGGRLGKSDLPTSQKHPILLPSKHPLTDLIIREIHEERHHTGIGTTLYALRQRFWILDGRNQVRRVIKRCVRCARFTADGVRYKMAELPKVRINPAIAFSNTGVDFCGPFFVKQRKFRNTGRDKVYVCIFICMAIKAVHLEVVGDLTTEGFLAAFKRFTQRRGTPRNVYSDNGLNFVGANNQLRELYVLFNSEKHKNKINQWTVIRNITWHFIPPLSPNFGGLWESTVKIFKHHLKRVVGEVLFTLEEFQTFCVDVEGILNSRPLTPLSSDPNDIQALSPMHYLIGEAHGELPEINFELTPVNRLSSWQHITRIRQQFWTRWSQEYLNELQQRKKWVKDGKNIRIGTIVIVKTKGLPCSQWPLARIIDVHPGTDDVVRTATIKTNIGIYKRSVTILCPLPFDED